MSVMNSLHDLHREDHLRHLLDQRAARADLHGRFPSLSEFSDSPSVYSRAHFSPPQDRAQLDPNAPTFDFVIPARALLSEPRSPMSDRERLNFPNASSLDLDDDPRSSYAFSGSHEDEDEFSPPEDEEDISRISTYGPKMTVHSRAPWELGEDDVQEQDEQEASGSKRSGNKKGESGKRVWGLGKGSSEKRPSTDSNRSQGKPKQSFESFSTNGGALLALAQASMSSTSLVSSPQPTLRDKLSLSRLRSRTPSNPNSSLEPIDTRLPPFPSQSTNISPTSRLMRTASPAPLSPLEPTFSDNSSRSSTPNTPHHEYTHPYANPDLVRRVLHDTSQPLPSPRQASATLLPVTSAAVNRSDSNATLTDTTTTSSMFQSRSNTTVSSLTPVTSMSSVNPSLTESSPPAHVHGKGISAPIPVQKPTAALLPAGMLSAAVASSPSFQEKASPKMRNRDTKLLSGAAPGAFPGWNDNSVSSAIKLISLEEAQAQMRERSRSATANPAISSSHANSITRSQPSSAESEPQSQLPNFRVRSTSAGGVKSKGDLNQRPPLPTEHGLGGGAVPPRLVTRKKSGFMRLFNAKERDRAFYSPPPPVPSMSDTTSLSSYPSSQPSRSRKASTHRVPVPSLSPSLLGIEIGTTNADSGSSSDSRSDTSVSEESGVARERQLSARRNAPGLSIVTTASMVNTSNLHPLFSASSEGSSHGHTVIITPTAGDSFSSALSDNPPPNSAPPGATDFVALSLRPVSTLFSTNFADQLASPASLSRPSLDTGTSTPTTATTAVWPLSPDFPLKAYPGNSDDKGVQIVSQDDQSGVVQALQEQILVARRAWQRQIWELEGQVRDLKAEVDELRAAENGAPYCSACGRGNVGRPGSDSSTCIEDLKKAGVKVGVVNRPRARTGVGSRFASGT